MKDPWKKRKKARLGPVLAGLAAALVVAVLAFPRSCSEYDSPPGTPPHADECPKAPTWSGLVWPNVYAGLALTPVMALTAGGVTYSLVANRRESKR